jgi:spore germination protein YaaH
MVHLALHRAVDQLTGQEMWALNVRADSTLLIPSALLASDVHRNGSEQSNLWRSTDGAARWSRRQVVYPGEAVHWRAGIKSDDEAPPNCAALFAPGCVWASTPPADCPLARSTKWSAVRFGAGRNYENVGIRADTWYPSWAENGDLYTPFEDGEIVVGETNTTVRAMASRNGWAILRGDDALSLEVVAASNAPAVNASAEIFARCNQNYVYSSLVHDGVWYLSKNCQGIAGPEGLNRLVNALFLGWPLGSIWSTDGGASWGATDAAARAPLFGDAATYPPPAMVAGRFVDFGQGMRHSPDGKAYVVASGAAPGSAPGAMGYATGDRITIGRVALDSRHPDAINDPTRWEFFAGRSATTGADTWSMSIRDAAPIFEWKYRAGPATLTYHPASRRYLLAVAARNASCGLGAAGWKGCSSDLYMAEASTITGPYHLVSYMQDFGPGGYFPIVPSKFLRSNGSGVLMFSAFDRSTGSSDPPMAAYSLSAVGFQLLPTPAQYKSDDEMVSKPQVVAFRSVSYGCSHGNNCIQKSYEHYNWTALTTVISFTATNLSDVVAMARAHNVRVIQGVMFSDHGQPSARFNTSRLEDVAYTAEWIGAAVAQVLSNDVHGFQLDVEHFHAPTPRMKTMFTAFVCSLQARLQLANRTLFSVDTQVWGNTEIFDLPALSACVEFLVAMAYDLVRKDGNASSNCPLPVVQTELAKFYLQAGVPPHKVILGLPAYGYAFPCAGTTVVAKHGDAPACHFKRGDPSSTWQIGLGSVAEKLQAGVATATGRDDVSGSPWFEFTETKHQPKGRRQVWYEDAQSLRVKSGLAWSQGLGGVALWSIDALWNMPTSAERQEVYAAVEPPATDDSRDGGHSSPAALRVANPPPPLHHSPACVRGGGWHDIAAALTLGSTHHVWQGCPGQGGWAHSTSRDLVRWQFNGLGPRATLETHGGMSSDSSPYSGFATLDDDGRLCAGFRQCSSTKGTTPLEIRCANASKNGSLEAPLWGPPQYLFSPYYHTNPLPYDPPSPWREQAADGSVVWRSTLSTHGCNGTDGARFLQPPGCKIDSCCKPPVCRCTSGGRLDLWEAPRLSGPWKQQAEPFFAINATAGPQPARCQDGSISNELVTTGIFGAIIGDPRGGKTVVVTSNYCDNLYSTSWIGSVSHVGGGKVFTPYRTSSGLAGGVVDFGPIFLVRTLGGDPRNQVSVLGRRIMVGQLRPFPFQDPPSAPGRETSQSLARELTLSSDDPPQLLQQFVLELKMARQERPTSNGSGAIQITGLQFEVMASFGWSSATPPQRPFGLCLNGPLHSCTALVVSCHGKDCQLQAWTRYDATSPARHTLALGFEQTAAGFPNSSANATVGPMPTAALARRELRVHGIGDGNIIESIWQNRTSTTLYFTPAEANTSVAVFGAAGLKVKVEAWRLGI